ncbi:hypothetical protein L7F22_068705 [Adiantum nelumboides]|nr:hypothetical protein [Adiantum nelumboides]
MPCNHISIVEEATTGEEVLSQAPSTPFPNSEEEAIYALNAMARQLLDEDTFLEDTSTINGVTYTRLMEEDDEKYFNDIGHQETPSTPLCSFISPTLTTRQCRRQPSETEQILSQPMLRNSNNNTNQAANSRQATNPALDMQEDSFVNENTHVISPTLAARQCTRQLRETDQILSQPMLRNFNDNTNQVANSRQAATLSS